MKVNLAKALKVRASVVRDLQQATGNLTRSNTFSDQKPAPFDAKAIMTEVIAIRGKLVVIKAAIASANAPIYSKMHELNELKAHITLLQSLTPSHTGTEYMEGWRGSSADKPINWYSTYNEASLNLLVKDAQKRIDTLQDEIDAFNHTAEIEIPD